MHSLAQVIKIIDQRDGRAINFIFGLEFLANGHHLYRISWKDDDKYLFLKEGYLLLNKPFYKGQKKFKEGYPFIISQKDIYAEDWFIR